jgi:hypothetical protein
VVANTGNKIESVWTDDGPRYGAAVGADDLDIAEHDAGPDRDGGSSSGRRS